MTPNEYQQKAGRTSAESYRNLPLPFPYNHLLHAHLGMSSETGEVAGALKKHFVYGQPLDVDNLIEECGDKLWYIALALTAVGYTMEQCMEDNIEKLKIRYPEKFTEEHAEKRLDKMSLSHDHSCNCGTATHTPHKIGTYGCVRSMTEAPIQSGMHETLRTPMWEVDGHIITDFSLRQQRGYYQHPCGCWSRCPGSENSIEA